MSRFDILEMLSRQDRPISCRELADTLEVYRLVLAWLSSQLECAAEKVVALGFGKAEEVSRSEARALKVCSLSLDYLRTRKVSLAMGTATRADTTANLLHGMNFQMRGANHGN